MACFEIWKLCLELGQGLICTLPFPSRADRKLRPKGRTSLFLPAPTANIAAQRGRTNLFLPAPTANIAPPSTLQPWSYFELATSRNRVATSTPEGSNFELGWVWRTVGARRPGLGGAPARPEVQGAQRHRKRGSSQRCSN